MVEVNRIASSNIIPDYFGRLQYITDSIRAYKWFNITSDSNYIKKYLPKQHKKHGTPEAPVVVRPAKDAMIDRNVYAKSTITDKRHP